MKIDGDNEMDFPIRRSWRVVGMTQAGVMGESYW